MEWTSVASLDPPMLPADYASERPVQETRGRDHRAVRAHHGGDVSVARADRRAGPPRPLR